MTSHDVVARVRRIVANDACYTRGHLTRSPWRFNRLIGRATRLAQFLSGIVQDYVLSFGWDSPQTVM